MSTGSASRDVFMRSVTKMHTYEVRGGDDFQIGKSKIELDRAAAAQREEDYEKRTTMGIKTSIKPRVDTTTGIGHPLDFSYQDVGSVMNLTDHDPSKGVCKLRPPPGPEEGEEASPAPKPRKSKSRLTTTGLKLGYNLLTCDGMANAVEAIDQVLDDPVTNLQMLDLQSNKFEKIPDLSKFVNLSVLYLHGNHITDINEVKKLKKLKNLKKLTLHGNDVFFEATEQTGRRVIRLQDVSYYRQMVIYMLRNTSLKCLDQIPITPKDMENARIWYQNFRS